MLIVRRIIVIVVFAFFLIAGKVAAAPLLPTTFADEVTSTRQEAIAFVDSIHSCDTSIYWPHIKPASFLQNLRSLIHNPISIYPGNGTNFCGYGALTYLFLQDDPLGYAKLLLQLYTDGKARFGSAFFNPSAAIQKAAGRLHYKGVLDIHPAEQLWFLTVADHYKGYLNIFNRRYDPGDEDTFWASVNLAKFNRMVKGLLHYQLTSKGSDLIRPHFNNEYQYISDRLQTGKVVLFINNRIVHKKNHVKIKLALPTHFIVVEKISREDDLITLVYWDYGGRTLLQLSAGFLKRIVFGITYCTKNDGDGK